MTSLREELPCGKQVWKEQAKLYFLCFFFLPPEDKNNNTPSTPESNTCKDPALLTFGIMTMHHLAPTFLLLTPRPNPQGLLWYLLLAACVQHMNHQASRRGLLEKPKILVREPGLGTDRWFSPNNS